MKRIGIVFLIFYINIFANQLNLTEDEKKYIKNKKVITVSNEYDYEPYDFFRDGKALGYSIDLLEAILKDTGLKIEYKTKPWNLLLEDLDNGKIDLVHTVLKTKNREKKYKYSTGYSSLIRNYIIRKNSTDINSIDELFGKKVGVSRGWSEENFFNQYPKIEKKYYKNIQDKLSALSRGEIDAIINSSNVVQYYIKKYNYNNLKISNPIKEKNNFVNYHFISLKNEAHLISIINKAYGNIPIEILDSLNQKWFGIIDDSLNKELLLNEKEKRYLSSKKSINMCIDPNWMPFESFNKNKHIGMTADYFKLFENMIGIPINVIKTNTWGESLKLGKQRKCDIFSLVMETPERKKYLDFTKEYFKTPLVFASEIYRPWVDSFEQIKDKKIGIVKGYAYGEIIKEKYPYINLIEVENIEDGLKKLEKGEFYGFIGSLATVGYHIQQNYIGQIKINGKFKEEWKLGIGTRSDEPILKNIFEKAIDNLTQINHQTILNRWISIKINKPQVNELTYEEKQFLKQHRTIRFLTRPSRPPFEFIEDGKVRGIAIEYIEMIAKKLGFNAEFVVKNISLKDAYKELLSEDKDFDTLLFSVKNKQRAKKVEFGDIFLSYPIMIIVNEKTPYVGKISDLMDKTVTVEDGFMIKKWLERDYPHLKIKGAKDTLEALTMLNKGKVDAYVGNMAVANYLSSNKGFDNIKIAAPSNYGTIDYRFVSTKQMSLLSSILSKGYRQITPAEHNLITQKWFSQRTIEKIDYSLVFKVIVIFIFIFIWMLWWSRKLQSEKKNTEKAYVKLEEFKDKLHKQKEEFELIFKYSKDGIAIIDTDSNFLNLNDAYTKLTGYSKKEILKMSCLDLTLDEEREQLIKLIKECISVGYVENFQNTYVVANDKKVFLNISMSLLPDKNRILIVAKDVSSLKLLEEQTRLASMGQMIGNIAHQWRQPLSMITTNASGVKLKLEYGNLDNDYIVENMDNIVVQANYLSKTIDNFRDFIKNENIYTRISIIKSLEQTLSILNASFKNNYINLVLNLEDDIEIDGNINELVESFINILNNSKDAIKQNVDNEDDRVIIITSKKLDKNSLELKIVDSGGGIDKTVLNHIFEPYFTTKHQSIGTGLGLSLVDKILRQRHKAIINVSNEKIEYNNKKLIGACFKIVFTSS